MANTTKKVAPIVGKATEKKSVNVSVVTEADKYKATVTEKGITVQLAEVSPLCAETSAEGESKPKKRDAKKDSSKESKKGQETAVDTSPAPVRVEESSPKRVALSLNKEKHGINLFFGRKKDKTVADSTFMKSLGMRWNGSCWYVKFKTETQLGEIINHFGDRLDVPEDLDSLVSELLSDIKLDKAETPKRNKTKRAKTTTEVGFSFDDESILFIV